MIAADLDTSMRALLVDLLKIPSVSGSEAAMTRFVAEWAAAEDFDVDLWQADEVDLQRFDWPIGRHLPLMNRPTLVLRLRGTGGGNSLLFNAHADVVSAGDPAAWQHDPWGGESVGDRLFGRGACDVKGPLVSALWAMTMLREHRPRGDVLLELIPGEEDCVGLGTLTSVARGWTADACIVLEPTENQPRCASRGGFRFEINVHGRAVHGTVKWLGVDAIHHAIVIIDGIKSLQSQFNDRAVDLLFDDCPFARPITVDAICGGEWQGMICERCRIGGYFELLPGDNLSDWKQRFETALRGSVGVDLRFDLTFPEAYFGHRTDPSHRLCRMADVGLSGGFNSGCEAGLRSILKATPTLVWGPGSLAQAHAADEYIEFSDVRLCAQQMARFAGRWCDSCGD